MSVCLSVGLSVHTHTHTLCLPLPGRVLPAPTYQTFINQSATPPRNKQVGLCCVAVHGVGSGRPWCDVRPWEGFTTSTRHSHHDPPQAAVGKECCEQQHVCIHPWLDASPVRWISHPTPHHTHTDGHTMARKTVGTCTDGQKTYRHTDSFMIALGALTCEHHTYTHTTCLSIQAGRQAGSRRENKQANKQPNTCV